MISGGGEAIEPEVERGAGGGARGEEEEGGEVEEARGWQGGGGDKVCMACS